MWYVEGFLLPSLTGQGIAQEEITVWLDEERKGNLLACMECFRARGERGGAAWHLQDDVVICRDFAARTKAHNTGIVCGFVPSRNVYRYGPRKGLVPVRDMWWSFQCIRIPDVIAAECADWFFNDAARRPQNRGKVEEGKNDDEFFRIFLLERHADLVIENLAPNLVDHVDYLIGGSKINSQRVGTQYRTAFWEDESIITDLENRIRMMDRRR